MKFAFFVLTLLIPVLCHGQTIDISGKWYVEDMQLDSRSNIDNMTLTRDSVSKVKDNCEWLEYYVYSPDSSFKNVGNCVNMKTDTPHAFEVSTGVYSEGQWLTKSNTITLNYRMVKKTYRIEIVSDRKVVLRKF